MDYHRFHCSTHLNVLVHDCSNFCQFYLRKQPSYLYFQISRTRSCRKNSSCYNPPSPTGTGETVFSFTCGWTKRVRFCYITNIEASSFINFHSNFLQTSFIFLEIYSQAEGHIIRGAPAITPSSELLLCQSLDFLSLASLLSSDMNPLGLNKGLLASLSALTISSYILLVEALMASSLQLAGYPRVQSGTTPCF